MSPDQRPEINSENEIGKPNRNKRFMLKAAGALAALTIILPPVLHPENTIRIISALAGKDIDCTGAEQQDPRYQVDAIVVPGAGDQKRRRRNTPAKRVWKNTIESSRDFLSQQNGAANNFARR